MKQAAIIAGVKNSPTTTLPVTNDEVRYHVT
jgi:hypothetical protein